VSDSFPSLNRTGIVEGVLMRKLPTRILQYTYGGEQVSGIDSFLIEAYKALDTNELQFDFLYRYQIPLDERLQAELTARGSRIYSLGVPERRNPIVRQVKEGLALWSFFRRHRYEVIAINMTSVFMCIQAALISRLFGARAHIMHAHASPTTESRGKRLVKRFATPALNQVASHRWACSPDAAEYLFGKEVRESGNWEHVKNAIDVDRFRFDEKRRSRVRRSLNLSSEFAVAIVGRLVSEKNHDFALSVFDELLAIKPSARLFIVGSGPLEQALRDRAHQLDISDQVSFLGIRTDVDELFCAFDALMIPSIQEAFPLVAIEAQSSGLPLFVSDGVPEGIEIVDGTHRVRLDEGPQVWARALLGVVGSPRTSRHLAVAAAGYDSGSTAKHLTRLYHDVTAELAP
jgi:glycosyltransferase involved in cell wall biosynthesis